MGINVVIEDEQGAKLSELLDPTGLTKAVSRPDDKSTVCLRFIDPYGDTVFNQLQVPVLIDELEAARAWVSGEARLHLDRVLHLIRSDGRDVHTYVRFLGD